MSAEPPLAGFGDPTEYPDEPITAGAPLGDGPGVEALGLAPDPNADIAAVKKFIPLIAPWVDHPDTPDSVRELFRFVRDN